MYFVEHLANLSTLNVSIQITTKEEHTIEVAPYSITVRTQSQSVHTLKLPCEVSTTNVRITQSSNWIHIQAATHSKPDENDSKNGSYPTKFTCQACENILVSKSKFQKVLDLPSEYWFEMTECWACHHEDYSALPGQTGGIVLAQRGILMEGSSYFALHRDDVAGLLLHKTGREVCSTGFGDRESTACLPSIHDPTGKFVNISDLHKSHFRLHSNYSQFWSI
jgi:hypothetical protein